MKQEISTTKAPAAIGPYSQAIKAGTFLYISGQLPIREGKLAEGIEAQTEASLANIDGILEEAGCCRKDVVKTTIFLKNLKDFETVNAVYGRFFDGGVFPARSTVEIARLPRDALIEIEAVACKE
jgi:2-iminobutanoate/2-iminopropanoate deaminase